MVVYPFDKHIPLLINLDWMFLFYKLPYIDCKSTSGYLVVHLYLSITRYGQITAEIILQDEHLMNHIVKNNILKPIVDAFVANGNRYNLLNSAVLELFEYIRKVFIHS